MNFSFIERFLPMYAMTAQLILTIVVIDIAVSVVIGVTASLTLYYRILGLRQLVATYVELSRNTPLPVQLFFLYFGLPKIGIHLNPEFYGIVGSSPLSGTYITETLRAGLEMIERIQSESALLLDTSQAATIRCVVLPQVMTVSVPFPAANMIFLIKGISVFNGIALVDFMCVTKNLIGTYYQITEALFAPVIVYLVLLLPISLFGSWAERRLHYVGSGN